MHTEHRRIAAILAVALCLMPMAVAGDSPDLATAKAMSRAYAEVAARVLPSVVQVDVMRMHYPEGDFIDVREIPDDVILKQFLSRFQDVNLTPSPSTVLRVPRFEGDFGSGVLLDAAGHILTNHHVIGNGGDIRVSLFGSKRPYEADLVGADADSDLAVLKLRNPPADLSVARLGDSDLVDFGNIVLAIGSPAEYSHSVSAGVVSGKNRHQADGAVYQRFIQTDAALNPGNSGGPLYNLDGEVIGINTRIHTFSGGSQGLGFAIPVNLAKTIVAQIIEKGHVERGWFGIENTTDDPDISVELGHDGGGAVVDRVIAGSPAEQAGILPGDLVIEVDGGRVEDADQLVYQIADTPIGKVVPVVLLRDRKRVELALVVGTKPSDAAPPPVGADEVEPSAPNEDLSERLGAIVRDLDDEVRERFEIPPQIEAGVAVMAVAPDGALLREFVRPGAIVLAVNGRTVNNVDDFRTEMAAVPDGKAIILRLVGQNGYSHVLLKPE